MKKTGRINILTPLAPILFSISFVLVLFRHNIGELTLHMLALPLIAVTVFAIIIFIASTILTANRQKGSIVSSVFLLLFFSYGDIRSLLGNIRIGAGTNTIGAHHILLSLSFFLLFALFLSIKRAKKSTVLFLGRYLTIIAAVAVLFPLSRILGYEIERRTQNGPERPDLSIYTTARLDKDKMPDIYYIIPDSYSRADVLKTYFGYDNSAFIAFLQQKGFYVASQSASNYPKTFLSVSSSLNMEYLDYLSAYKNSIDQTVTDGLIEKNNVLRFLTSLGYHYYQMGSWWGSTSFNRFADDNYTIERQSFGAIGEFNYMVINSSMLNPFITKFLPKVIVGESDEDKRARILYQFGELPKIAKKPGPKFVFVHIISPHGPYVFGKDCEHTTYEQIKDNGDEQNYVNQLQCINKKLQETITSLLNDSVNPPVILLQADEGAAFLGGLLTPADNWKEAKPELIKQKFPILAAYYLPGTSFEALYPSISPVNSFRTILNVYFSTNLPLIPDKHYTFQDTQHLYEFIDVSQFVEKKG